MRFTWIAIIASSLAGIGALLIFITAILKVKTRNTRKNGTRGTFSVCSVFPRVPRLGLAGDSVRLGEARELNLTHFTNSVG
jgi:hypothetical protein